jgi:hypothetical protein
MGVYEIKCRVYFEIHCIMNTADQRAILSVGFKDAELLSSAFWISPRRK